MTDDRVTADPGSGDSVITVLIVDDHPLVRAGLRGLLAATADLAVVAEAGDGESAIALALLHSPDVVLMDLSMPGIDGVETTRRLLRATPGLPVVILTSFQGEARVVEALRTGAIGYLLKDSDPDEVLAAVRAAAGGEVPIDSRVARALLPRDGGGRPVLSARESQVLKLITDGLSNKQIATQLGIAERTVKVHAGNLFRQLGVSDRTSAAMWARDNLRY